MDNIVYVYDKFMNLIAEFSGNTESYDEIAMQNVMVSPTVHIEQNGASTFSFQMLVNCEKWQTIKNPENIYYVNGRYYSPLNEGSYVYTGNGSIRVVNVTAVETWYLLDKKFTQVYNCGLYCYAEASFVSYTTDGAIFRITSTGCSNPGNTISYLNAWNQVKLWKPTDDNGNSLTYSIIKNKGFEPKNWENTPASVCFKSISISGNTATVTISARSKIEKQQKFDYTSNNLYYLDVKPFPASIKKIYVNSTILTETDEKRTYKTQTKKSGFSYSSSYGRFSLSYTKLTNETINYIIAVYEYSDIGNISTNATCTFAYGAEVVDEHTFIILPKADKKYKLTIDGVEYDDSQVKDSRGVLLPRGSAGYAMWAALKNSGWKLGICDVIAKGFNTSIDYGCFNLESDMKDVLYIVQYIQELYGGILDWDSKNKILNYRAENNVDYTAYNDEFNQWTGYEFREGKNIKDQPQITYDNDLITRAYLLGYGNINVKSVNDGKSYVENYSYTTDTYSGYLEQPLIFDTNDDSGKKQLLYWGENEIRKRCRPRKTISINAVDIRTVEGYEHEVFDINNIVKVYIRDDDTKKEISEEHRIILWEYNVFALWNSKVELGEKTRNLSELFKQIYNSSVENSPKINASGKISSDEIVMEIDLSEFGFDAGDIYGGSDIYGTNSSGTGLTLTDYVSLIVQKTTANTNAISGLTMEANDVYTKTELFSSFQSNTDNMISDTYAGLKTYADSEMSSLSATVSGNYRELNNAIWDIEVQTNAGFRAQQTVNNAFSEQQATISGRVTNLETGQTNIYNQYAGLKSEVELGKYSINKLTTDFNNAIYDENGVLQGYIKSFNEFKQEATEKYAKTTDLTEYIKTDKFGNVLSHYKVEISKYADENLGVSEIRSNAIAAKNGVTAVNSALTVSTVTGINLHVPYKETNAYVSVGASGDINITTGKTIRVGGNENVVLSANTGSISIYGKKNVTISTAGTLYIAGKSVVWKSRMIAGQQIEYLGHT